jgi:hypothetical protein
LFDRLSEFHSEQTSLAAYRTLRQICVDETSRGLFIQQGGLKMCTEAACDDSKLVNSLHSIYFLSEIKVILLKLRQKTIRQEAAHAIAKSLITTNPHLLSDSLRLSSIRPLLYLCQYVSVFKFVFCIRDSVLSETVAPMIYSDLNRCWRLLMWCRVGTMSRINLFMKSE